MKSTFRDRYKVEKSTIDLSDEMQLGLANNEEYDKMTDELCIKLYSYFLACNPNVLIESPRKRVKSPKSIHEKSNSREIERLTKLYAIEGIDGKDIKALYQLIKERIQEKEQTNEEKILSDVKVLLEQNIEKLDIETFLNNIMVDSISSSTKKALLRILKSKIDKSNLENRENISKELDEKYGVKAAEKSGNPEDDKIQYETIEKISKDKDRKELLYDRIGYLKSEDLMATKIVIADSRYNDHEMKEIAANFIKTLVEDDKKFLEKNGIEIIPFSLKHKNKTNGYEAEHIKFRFKNKPEYTMELQVKSSFVENLSRANGKASHENRPGKERVLPDLENKEQFIKQVQYCVPRYTLFKKGKEGYTEIEKCSMLKNVIGYYENIVTPEMYDKIYEILSDDICK